jgi:energy-coupling factor transport system ATP-binding protein
MEEAARADRVVVVNDGEIILDGTAKDVFYNVELLRSLGLEAPQGRELIFELARLGIIEDKRELTEEECIKTLLDLTLGKSE